MSAQKTNQFSIGMIVLLASVALNGALAGVIIAKKTNPVPSSKQQMQTPRGVNFSAPADPRRVLRHLSPERRRDVLKKAMKAVPSKDRQQFRKLRAALGQAEKAVFEAARAENYNPETLSTALGDLSAARGKLGQASDVLLANIWEELTQEERTAALEAMRRQNQRQQKGQQRRRQKRQD